jgi:VanZ family protein
MLRRPVDSFSWRIVCLSWVLLILIVCTVPWEVGPPRWWRVNWIPFIDALHSKRRLFDAVANFILYVPLGVSYCKARMAPQPRVIVEAGVLAAVLAAGCEFYQIFSPVRFPSMTDFMTNTAGALAGAFTAGRFRAPSR